VEFVCVGTELLAGKVNTHAAYLSTRLRGAGLSPEREATLVDDEEEIREAIASAAARADVVLVAGGLGPTFDDITREGASAALGRPLEFRAPLWKKIERRYRRFKFRVPVNNKRQAWVLAGAKVLDNPLGSAPGQWLELKDGTIVILMPGPFRELDPMFSGTVLPELKRIFSKGRAAAERVLRLYGVPESEADRRVAPLLERHGKGVEATILADLGRVSLHFAASAANASEAARRLSRLEKAVRKEFGDRVYGTDGDTLESVLGARLRRKRWRVAVAESCTGGLLGQRLTQAPGSSSYFSGGIIAYADPVKTRALGVPASLIRKEGAVSEACAKAMALGVRTAVGSEVGIAITGIAGPSGGSRKKPVGLVHVAVATPNRAKARDFLFPGTREQVRSRAASAAIALALDLLP
jgi:nicotinamide-nucleotide amidase